MKLHHLLDLAKEHPKTSLLLGGAGLLALVTMADKKGGMMPGVFFPLAPDPKLPGGIFPKGTTSLTSYLSDAFFKRLGEMGDRFRQKGANVTNEEIMAVLFVESGGLFPSAINAQSGCVGLNQICGSLTAVGFVGTKSEYRALLAEDQLPYVERYYDNRGVHSRIRNLGDFYLVNFSPAFLGQPQEYVMYRKGETVTHPFIKKPNGDRVEFGPVYYAQNEGIDRDPTKGFIRVGDMAPFIVRNIRGAGPKWDELRARLLRNTVLPNA